LEDGGRRVRFVTLPQGITPWMRSQWVVLEEALAAFEVFKNSQSEISVEDHPASTQSVVPEEPASSEPPFEIFPNEVVPYEKSAPLPKEIDLTEKPIEIPEDKNPLSSDRVKNSHFSGSPFYEEDYSSSEIFPTQQVDKEPEQDHEFWKDMEAERVKDALVHPPNSDFAGILASDESRQSEKPEPKPDVENNKVPDIQPETKSQELGLPKVSWPGNDPITDHPPIDYAALDNPPPIRPLEDTPPSIIQPAQQRARTMFNTPEEDL
jgi:hypothetical protein